jgi:hypothetical protein
VGYVKINVDAATSKNSSTTAVVATLARDASGTFLGASTFVLKGITKAEITESLFFCDLRLNLSHVEKDWL